MNEIGHGLGLGEIDPAIEKCALGEFTGFGKPRAGAEQGLQNEAGNEHAAMTGNLHGILPGKAAWIPKDRDQDIVQFATALNNMTIVDGMTFGGRRFAMTSTGGPETGIDDRERRGAGNPEHRQSTLAQGRGEGGDGVEVGIHGRARSRGGGLIAHTFQPESCLLETAALEKMAKLGIHVGGELPGERFHGGEGGTQRRIWRGRPSRGHGGFQGGERCPDGIFERRTLDHVGN